MNLVSVVCATKRHIKYQELNYDKTNPTLLELLTRYG